MTIFYLTQIALGFAVYWSLYWLAVPLVLVSSHLMHGVLIALHEASHGLLRKNRTLNEIDGILMAAFGGMSFSLYRVVHQSHHAHLATERDEELWPFVHPGVSRPREFSPPFSNWVWDALHAVPVHPRICPAGIDDSKKACAGASGRSSASLCLWIVILGAVPGSEFGNTSSGCTWRQPGWPQTCKVCANTSSMSA